MTDTTSVRTETAESVDEFATRARAWLADNMPLVDPANPPAADRGKEEPWLRARELQRKLHDGGFAGICFPREYGGLGLPYEYQKAFDNESRDYEMPVILNTPTFTICGATLLDTGTEVQKRQRIPAFLRGDEILVQLLSEPAADPTWPVSSPGPIAEATSGSSTARRRGAPAPSPPTTGSCWRAPIGRCPNTRA